MKSIIQHVVIAAVAFAPLVVFAQSTQTGPMTRAQVRSELIALQKAGYNPVSDDASYPTNLLIAEAKIQQQNNAQSEGGTRSETSQSGKAKVTRTVPDDWDSMYTH